MTHRIFVAAAAATGAAAFIWVAAQIRWERQMLAEQKRSGSPWKR